MKKCKQWSQICSLESHETQYIVPAKFGQFCKRR